jgi:uncharacterized protein (DUF1330 family)
MKFCQPGEKSRDNPALISYKALRRAVGILGISLPVILIAGSMIFGGCMEIQSSISAYYHTNMRNIFVGIICAIALFMFAYKGYDRRDAIAGKLACLFALGVAFFPTSVGEPLSKCIPGCIDKGVFSTIHFISAALFFLVLSYFSICLFTIKKEPVTERKILRNKLYRISGYGMLVCLALIALYAFWLKKFSPALQNYDPIFWLEFLALCLFGGSWLLKGEAMLKDTESGNRYYFIAQIRIRDEDEYQKYIEKAWEVFRRYRGTYLAVDDRPLVLEGSWSYTRCVLISFESRSDFHAWYDSEDYQEILKHRLAASDCDSILIEGKD